MLLLGCLWVEVSVIFDCNDKMMLGIEAWGDINFLLFQQYKNLESSTGDVFTISNLI
jgi:hypothetical protein